jgi:hypothetical protein
MGCINNYQKFAIQGELIAHGWISSYGACTWSLASIYFFLEVEAVWLRLEDFGSDVRVPYFDS